MIKTTTFGKEIARNRKNLKLSQEKLSELSFLDIRTIRGIENDKINISIDYLEILSPILKIDLVKLYMENRFYDYNSYTIFLEEIEEYITERDVEKLTKNYHLLEKLYPLIKNSYYKGTRNNYPYT